MQKGCRSKYIGYFVLSGHQKKYIYLAKSKTMKNMDRGKDNKIEIVTCRKLNAFDFFLPIPGHYLGLV